MSLRNIMQTRNAFVFMSSKSKMQNRDVFVLMSVRNQHHSMSSTRYVMNEDTDYQIRTLSNYE